MVALALFTLIVVTELPAGVVVCRLAGLLPFQAGVVVGVIGFAGVSGCGVVGPTVFLFGV